MAKPNFPWRDGRPLTTVLATSRKWLERKRIVKKGAGCPQSMLAATEKRMGQPLPNDIRTFLSAVQPIRMFKDENLNEDGPAEFYFYGPDQPEMNWQSLSDWPPTSDWSRATGLAIGQTGYGDLLVWVKGHRVHPDGCIAVADHEMAIGDLPCAILARSLSELIAKVVQLKGLSPGLDDDLDELNEDDIFGLADQELFDQEYGELNPTSKKARRRKK